MRHFNRDSLDYQFIDKIEAGLSLTGSDAKSLRIQPAHFKNSHIEIVGGRPVLLNLEIPIYKYSHGQTIDTSHTRSLLLSQKEISKLQSFRHQKYMLIPISLYTKGKWFKVEIGIGRKMRKYEKREKIKQKDLSREIR